MGFEVQPDTSDGKAVKFNKVGQFIEGIYLGSKEVKTKFGMKLMHSFETERGVEVIFGQAHLTKLLRDHEPGILVRITYKDNKEVGKGNPMKVFELGIDKSFGVDAGAVAKHKAAVEAEAEDDYVNDSDDGDLPADEQLTAAAKAKVAAKPPSAAAQSRVQALLNRNRTAS